MRDKRERLDPESWNVIDQRSGFKKKASEVHKQWDGLLVSREEFETRHPQDFVRSQVDKQSPDVSRPEGVDCFHSFVDQDTLETYGAIMVEEDVFLATEDGDFIRI